jgi:hypothetical protein
VNAAGNQSAFLSRLSRFLINAIKSLSPHEGFRRSSRSNPELSA